MLQFVLPNLTVSKFDDLEGRHPNCALHFHSDTEIGKISLGTWMRVCKATTMIVMTIIPSLDWFGWVNVLFPMFRFFFILCKNSWCI